MRSLAELVCGESCIERLTPDQAGQVCLLLEWAVRGRVGGRSLESWLAQVVEGRERRAALEALQGRLAEKVKEVELGGRREAA